MSRAVLSIGANLGDRLAALQSAVDGLGPWLLAVSSVYETDPWGPVAQDDFLNAVLIAADPAAGPVDWLDRAHQAEAAAGRVREVHWGPRTLDVDVLDVDGIHSTDPVLTLPHPRAAERAFVLVPWVEIDPRPELAAQLARLPVADRESVRIRLDLALQWPGSLPG
jgi:2-amino-4-hydroxy-6-hydroxymethyldihydropteridine diphosphokinase